MLYHVSTLNFSAGIDARTKHPVSKGGIRFRTLGTCTITGFQSFSGFGIFFWHLGILTILAFLASLTFWHYEIQKKAA